MQIKKIIVKKLFGTKDFTLNLNDGRGFFFGENGAGKTTFLNIIYAILSGEQNLIPPELKYEEFIIEFDNGQKLESNRLNKWPKQTDCQEASLINHYNQLNAQLSAYINYLESIKINYPSLAGFELEDKIKSINNQDIELLITNSSLAQEFIKINQSIAVDLGNGNPTAWYNNAVAQHNHIRTVLQQNNLQKSKTLLNNIENDILYLNVYRNRPKVNLLQLKSPTEQNLYEEGAIVLTSQKLDELKKKVQDSANEMKTLINKYYIEMSNTLLNKLLSHEENKSPYSLDDEEIKLIEKVFTYIHGIDSVKKEKLKNILLRNDSDATSVILKKSFKPFINEYRTRALPIEEQIEKFLNVINKYLVHKKIKFDKANFNFMLEIGTNTTPLDEKLLSSGEKHIFSVFSNLVFNKKDSIHLLIDEPELSLSITWQKMFIEDITEFEKVKNLIFVTHSPYVIPEEMVDDLQKFPSSSQNG